MTEHESLGGEPDFDLISRVLHGVLAWRIAQVYCDHVQDTEGAGTDASHEAVEAIDDLEEDLIDLADELIESSKLRPWDEEAGAMASAAPAPARKAEAEPDGAAWTVREHRSWPAGEYVMMAVRPERPVPRRRDPWLTFALRPGMALDLAHRLNDDWQSIGRSEAP